MVLESNLGSSVSILRGFWAIGVPQRPNLSEYVLITDLRGSTRFLVSYLEWLDILGAHYWTKSSNLRRAAQRCPKATMSHRIKVLAFLPNVIAVCKLFYSQPSPWGIKQIILGKKNRLLLIGNCPVLPKSNGPITSKVNEIQTCGFHILK